MRSGQNRTKYDYDAKSRLTSIVTRKPDLTEIGRIQYEYDDRDRRVKATYPLLSREAVYTYDPLDRLKSETWSQLGGGTTPLACSGNNTQDLPIGNRSAPAESNDVTTPPSGTTIVYSASWTYDGAGNRLTQLENAVQTTYEYDAQNRLERELQNGLAVVSYSYDLNGNQLSRTENSVVEAFSYDYMNRIETYAKGSTSFIYKYTPDGKRLAKIDAAGPQEWFMYDGDDVTADYTRTGSSGPRTLARTYVNGRSIDAKIARIDEPAGTLNYYVGDAIGSVHEMISPAGTIVRQALYAAWGKPLPGFGGVPFQDRHSFTQREEDPESGLMHYRARSYDHRVGRFAQKDPELYLRVATHYSYAEHQPTLLADPRGLFSTGVHTDITRAALAEYDEAALKEIIAGNLGQDKGDAYYNPLNHFDDNKVSEAYELVEKRFKDISDPAKVKTLSSARNVFGMILHALQDFNSHSNFVEQWIYAKNRKTTKGGIESFGKQDEIAEMVVGDVAGIKYFDFAANKITSFANHDPITFFPINSQFIMTTTANGRQKGVPTHAEANKDGIPCVIACLGETVNHEVGGNGHANWKTKDGFTLHALAVQAAKNHTKAVQGQFLEALRKNGNFSSSSVARDVLKAQR